MRNEASALVLMLNDQRTKLQRRKRMSIWLGDELKSALQSKYSRTVPADWQLLVGMPNGTRAAQDTCYTQYKDTVYVWDKV